MVLNKQTDETCQFIFYYNVNMRICKAQLTKILIFWSIFEIQTTNFTKFSSTPIMKTVKLIMTIKLSNILINLFK